jgi:hypothetical protein
MFGFSLAFFWIKAYEHTEHDNFGSQFLIVYKLAFSDFEAFTDSEDIDTSDFSHFDWIAFASCHFLICIVMMTLLIGIISDEL